MKDCFFVDRSSYKLIRAYPNLTNVAVSLEIVGVIN